MKFPHKDEAIKSLAEMEEELNGIQSETDSYLSDMDEIGPEEFDFEGADLDDEEKEKADKIKTPEDAKKVLNTCKDDLQKVIDSLDGLSGQVSEELSEASFKRYNEKYASSLISLAGQTDRVISDAKDAMKYWTFLRKAKKVKNVQLEKTINKESFTDPIDKAFSQIEKSMTFLDKMANTLGYVRKDKVLEVAGKEVDATAVPPTGAEFTGDKWPQNKNTAEVELRHWNAGSSKFDRDKSFEDARPNAATEHRLDNTEYTRNDAPYVNASFKFNKENKFSSYWEIVDVRSGKKVIADFVNVPPSIGKKNEESFKIFSSNQYGKRILENVKATGIEAVAKSLGGVISKLDGDTLKVVAADKGSLRSYYTDAFGDSGYAADLVAGKDNSMDVGYTPKDDSVSSKDTTTKDGTGKLSKKDKEDTQKQSTQVDHEVLRARSRQAIKLARKLSSRGAIPFVKAAIMQKAEELMELDEEQFAATEKTIEDIPVVNEAALKSAHIPETEIGIVGNKSEGVRDQTAQVKTEDIDSGVKSDANVSKKANLVPQTVSADNKTGVRFAFNTVAKRLHDKGITPDKLRIAKRV